MAFILKVECSMCGNTKGEPPLEIEIERTQDFDLQIVKGQIEAQAWIVEFNGESIDTYCCAGCAQ